MPDTVAYIGGSPLSAAYYTARPSLSLYWDEDRVPLADYISDFLAVNADQRLGSNFVNASSGDNRMVAAANGTGGRFFVQTAANEVPVVGSLHRRNRLTDLNMSGYGKIKNGAEAVTPVITNNYVNDPVYGQCARIQLDAGSSGAGGNYSWAYKNITTGSTARRTVSVAMPVKLTSSYNQVDSFNGDGTTKIFTMTNYIVDSSFLVVTINGVVQVAGIDFTFVGKTLTFIVAPPTGTGNVVATITAKCLTMTRGLGTGAACNVGNTWKTIQGFFAIAAGAGADYGVGWNVSRGGVTDTAVDFLVPMNTLYGPVVEVVSDRLLPRPQLDASTNYGWGASGVDLTVPDKLYPPNFTFAGVTRFDDFHRADTALGVLSDGPQGQEYDLYGDFLLAPATTGQISGNKFVAAPPTTSTVVADYAMEEYTGAVSRFGAIVQYMTNPPGPSFGPTGYTWALLLCMTRFRFTDRMIHVIGTHIGYRLEIWWDGEITELTPLISFPAQMVYGQNYPLEFRIDGDELSFYGPGVLKTVSDPRISQIAADGHFSIREHYVAGPSSNLLNYIAFYATIDGESPVSSSLYEDYTPFVQVPSFAPAPAKTNNVTYSADFSNAAWVKTNLGTVTALTAATQKIEAQQVWKLPETTTNGLHCVEQATGLGAVQQTATVMCAAVERGFAFIELYNATDGAFETAIVNLSTGDATTGSATVDRQLGDGVWIISITGTPTTTGTVVRAGPALDGSTKSYAGTTGSGIACYYIDAEEGIRFTGPIVTAGSAGSRSVDQPNSGDIFPDTDWTLFAQFTVTGSLTEQVIVGGTTAVQIRVMADGSIEADNGTTQLSTGAGVVTAGQYGVVVRKDGADGAIFVNGAKEVDATYDFNVGVGDDVGLLATPAGGDGGSITSARVRCLNDAMSDAYCEALSEV